MPSADVEIWLVDLSPDSHAEQRARKVLSGDERDRADRVLHPAQRSARVRTRAALRHVLGDHLGIPPQEVPIDTGADGKPELALSDGPGRPHFNVSRSGRLALVALCVRQPVGIDIEHLRDFEWAEVADSFFAPTELAAIERSAPDDRRDAFFHCWVRKEAYLKGIGTGLLAPTTDFDVPFAPAGGIVHDSDPTRSRGATWYVRRLDVGAGYAAALAIADEQATLELRGLECGD